MANRQAADGWRPRGQRWAGWLLGAALALGCAVARANDATLVRLMQTGRIVLGASDGAVPLSYLDPSGAHVGYHMDVCLRIVQAIQQRFDLPPLKVTTLPSNGASRFALLGNGAIDIDCGYNPVKPSALSQALLSHATMVSELRLSALASSGLSQFAQLGGKTVASPAGSSALAALRALSRSQRLRIGEAVGRQSTDTFAMLVAGQADAVALPLPDLILLRGQSADPSRYTLMDGVLLAEPLALMFRLEDEKLHALANEVLAAMMKSGEMARLYEHWFMQPIPGRAQPLGLPLPGALRALFDAPGSELLAL